MSRFRSPDRLLDMQGVADLLNISYRAVQKIKERGGFPEPAEPGLKVWWRSVVVAWAKETGRWEY